jgi:hypothetical protein
MDSGEDSQTEAMASMSRGHATCDLENPDDIAARKRYARLKEERDSWWAADGTGGYSEDPPF